jgi:hypothetical protein
LFFFFSAFPKDEALQSQMYAFICSVGYQPERTLIEGEGLQSVLPEIDANEQT